jgi:pectin methylesterase-like acyl-CoA thioesterase
MIEGVLIRFILARSNMNTYSVSRLTLALAFGVTLSACSSTPADQQPSTQTAPGTASRPVLTADEAKNFTGELFPVSRS